MSEKNEPFSKFELEFYATKLRQDIYNMFIELAFSRGHKSVDDIARFVSFRLSQSFEKVRPLIISPDKWSLGNVVELFIAYGCQLKFDLKPRRATGEEK